MRHGHRREPQGGHCDDGRAQERLWGHSQGGPQGVVKAQIVLKGGVVQEVNMVSGPRVFHAAVKAAIMQYKCVADGAGAEVTVTQEFNFKID